MSMLKPDELDVIMALPRTAKKEKLSKRASDLLELMECQLEVCSSLPPKINVRAMICLLAGSKALDPALHAQFAAAGYIASLEQVGKQCVDEKTSTKKYNLALRRMIENGDFCRNCEDMITNLSSNGCKACKGTGEVYKSPIICE